MKVGRFICNLLARNSMKSTYKRRKIYPPHGEFKELINVQYIDDNNPQHAFDVILPDKNRKNVCVIDIHGGSYMFGEHQDNYPLGYAFAKEGFDFIATDYVPNDGKRDTKDLVDDVAKSLEYIFSHQKELGIEGDDFAITGDSAGGHFAILFAELLDDKEFANKLGYNFPDIKLVACLANCPVYDFVHIGDNSLTNSGMKRMFGPNYKDRSSFELLSPKEHLDSLKSPLFVSTCSQDFLRIQSLMLQEDMKKKDIVFKFVDITSDKKGIAHVHNVLHPEYEESKVVNEAMFTFIEDNMKK